MANKKTEAIENKKPKHPAVQVQEWLYARSDKLAEWCVNGGIDQLALIRVGSRLVAKEEKFQDPKTWPSLYLALITAAQLGLEPEGPRGEAYLVPYWDKKMQCHLVQLQPGYRGLMKLITKSGEIKSIRSQVVYENDTFEMQFGTNKMVDHQPAWKDRGNPAVVYSIATYANGDEDYELASWEDVMKAKASAQGKSPAWDRWPDQMARKFVIKRHANQLPMNSVARQAIMIDNIDTDTAAADAQGIIDAEVLDEAPPKALPAKNQGALEAKLKERKAKAEEAKAEKERKAKATKEPDDDAKKREKHGDGPPPAPAQKQEPDFPQCELCGFEAPKGKELCQDCESSVDASQQ